MSKLPNFFEIDLPSYNQQLSDMLTRFRADIKQLTQQSSYSWSNLMLPMDEMDDELSQFWAPVSHLNSVVNSEQLRQVYKEAVTELSQYSTEVKQDPYLYQAIKQVQPEDDIQKKILEDEMLGFKLSGIALDDDKKRRFAEIQAELSQLATDFEANLLDATNSWKKSITDLTALNGLPEHALNTAKSLATKDCAAVLTLDFPCYQAVVTYAEDSALREEMYQAFVTRASETGPHDKKFDNSAIIERTLALKHEKALLLGFNNYAELSLATKMAPSCEQVSSFLTELAEKSLKQAQQEYQELESYAGKKLQPWDIAFYSEKLLQEKYAISQEELRPYFPQSKVIKGMLKITNKLYDIYFEELHNVNTWHPDVKYYELYDKDGGIIGGLYVDLYARENKRGGAWMDDCICYREKADGEIQRPVAFLTCNFAPPSSGKEAYFSHDEVLTLFHEFGHCLHHLLTKIPYLGASGINGVEWDAVELPSQFFENWCWQQEALTALTAHKDTQEPLSEELFAKLNRAKNFQSAMAMLRQLEFALFDFSIHQDYNPAKPESALTTLRRIRDKYSVVPYPEFNRFPHGFSHIFAGGYAAGYYSYKWAEVLSSDAFSRFEEEGIFNKKTGQSFLNEILSKGSSRSALESFIAFRGREPQSDALLRHSGING
jgi:oligopeptidase A